MKESGVNGRFATAVVGSVIAYLGLETGLNIIGGNDPLLKAIGPAVLDSQTFVLVTLVAASSCLGYAFSPVQQK